MNNFIRLFIIISIINILFSAVIVFLSPEQIPTELNEQVFTRYVNSSYIMYFTLIFIIIMFILNFIMCKFMPITVRMYPQGIMARFISMFYCIEINKKDVPIIIPKVVSSLVLTVLLFLFLNSFIALGMAWQIKDIGNYFFVIFFILLIFTIPLARFFFRKL